MESLVTPDAVQAAAATIAGAVLVTPAHCSQTLSEIAGRELWLKFENLQFTGSFKERGARNFLMHLDEAARARGVVAASAGNHAQGVAYHARLLGIPATIVMPADTPFSKVSNTQHLGAEVVLHGSGYDECRAESERVASERGATIVPAFDDPLIIAGQGTIGLELLEQVPGVDTIVVPIGGGGLIAGIATAVKDARPDVAIVGVQVEGYEGMLHALGRHATPAGGATIAEGIAVSSPGTITREIVKKLVDDIVVVTEQQIEEAIAVGVEIEKTVLEGAGAAGLSAALERSGPGGGRVAVVLTGGNIDARVLSSVLMRALARTGRLVRLRIDVPDRPGVLATVAEVVGAQRGNIVDVAHRRDQPGVAVKRTMLELSVETRDRAHAEEIVRALTEAGFRVDSASDA